MQLYNFKSIKIGPLSFICVSLVLVFVQSNAATKSNVDMVEDLKSKGIIKSDLVERTMMAIDRKNYCNSTQNPYLDEARNIGHGASMSPPHMHAYALELLKDYLKPGGSALDIGSGSGYMTVCMAIMLGEDGHVVGIDHIPELVNQSTTNVRDHQPWLLSTNRIKFITGDGRKGYPRDAPYRAIYLGASVPKLPLDILKQLTPGGRFVGPIGTENDQYITVVDKTEHGIIKARRMKGIRYILPLFSDKQEQLSRSHIGRG